MAPVKFEEQIKDKLEQRVLQPSENSWAKLSQKLETQEKKSKSKWFWRLGIAVSLLIMIAISLQFLQNHNENNITPYVLEESTEKEYKNSEDNNRYDEPREKTTELTNDNKIESVSVAISKTEKTITKQQISNTKISKTQVKNMTNLVAVDIENHKEQSVQDLQKNNIELISQKDIEDVLSKLNTATAVTDKEVDSLLKIASKELFKEKLKHKSSNVVDADQLLLSVEDELGQSFRTKVFEALKNSYETVKTAVAERNN